MLYVEDYEHANTPYLWAYICQLSGTEKSIWKCSQM